MALCKTPIHLKQAGGIVPCGQCFTCRLNKARFWTFRLMMEARLHEKTFWTCLTYKPEREPPFYLDPNTGEYFGVRDESVLSRAAHTGTLSPRDLELFWKRVRKKLPPKTLRYFSVGEYGESLNPHYHLCIFGYGEEILPLLRASWIDVETREPLGFVDSKHCGPITTQNARYTCGYTLKKLTKRHDPRLEGRYPEFTSHSQGIGVEFATRHAAALNNPSGLDYIRRHGDIPRTVMFDGKRWPLDRYLRDKVLSLLEIDNPGLKNELLAMGKIRFQKEMSSLSRRAEENSVFTQTVGAPSPYVLTTQYQSETRQKVLNTETRAKLKLQEKKL